MTLKKERKTIGERDKKRSSWTLEGEKGAGRERHDAERGTKRQRRTLKKEQKTIGERNAEQSSWTLKREREEEMNNMTLNEVRNSGKERWNEEGTEALERTGCGKERKDTERQTVQWKRTWND